MSLCVIIHLADHCDTCLYLCLIFTQSSRGANNFAAGKLRTADCVAVGNVDAVVMSKREFQDLDNPLLAWMIDYDAVAAVLKVNHCTSSLAPCPFYISIQYCAVINVQLGLPVQLRLMQTDLVTATCAKRSPF